MRDKIIRIQWSDPLLLDDAIASDLSKKQGLYYITRVFGKKETSLYLGIARKNNMIKHRLEGHRDCWLPEYRGKIYVRIGIIIYPKISDVEKKADIIDHAESAILFEPEHGKMFPENISKRKTYSYSELYRIENTGNIYQLKPIIRMHEHEDDFIQDEANSLVNRWANDPNPVRVSGEVDPNCKKIQIRIVDDLEEALGGKK